MSGAPLNAPMIVPADPAVVIAELAEKAGRYEAALTMIECAFRTGQNVSHTTHLALIAAGLRPMAELAP